MAGNEMKNKKVQQQKKCQTKIKRKTPEQRSSTKKFNLSSKTLSRYQTNILLRRLKFTPTTKQNNIFTKQRSKQFREKSFSKAIYFYPSLKQG